jgi:hypothetical protein
MSTFHGYAPSSNMISVEVVYANEARSIDLQELAILGINVNGAIVVAKLPSFIEEVSLSLSTLGQCLQLSTWIPKIMWWGVLGSYLMKCAGLQ